jgi:hypothetical protein
MSQKLLIAPFGNFFECTLQRTVRRHALRFCLVPKSKAIRTTLQDYSEAMAYGSISLSFLPISISCSRFIGIQGNVNDTPTVNAQQIKVRVHNRLGVCEISYALYLWHLGTASRDRVGTHRPSIFRSSQYTTASIPVLWGIS